MKTVIGSFCFPLRVYDSFISLSFVFFSPHVVTRVYTEQAYFRFLLDRTRPKIRPTALNRYTRDVTTGVLMACGVIGVSSIDTSGPKIPGSRVAAAENKIFSIVCRTLCPVRPSAHERDSRRFTFRYARR